jgi:dihydrofolate reductase
MKASVFVGTSLDGFIAREDGGLDFLDAGGDEPHGYEEFIASIDALVVGRNTLDLVLTFAEWPYGATPVFVLSTRPLPPLPAGAAERMEGDPATIVAALEARGVEHAYVDGGVTVQRFLRAGLIDRLVVSRVPVLIGRGIPLFGALERDVALRHVATRSFAGGLVQSEYEVVRG